MSTLRMPRPNAKQDLFLRDTHRHVAYGGARGGGKSWVVRWKGTILAMGFAGIKIAIIRKTYKELLNNHILPLQQILHGFAKYNKQDHVFYFPNGSTIAMGYCASDSDLGQYQGAEYDVIFFEEASNLKEEWIMKIRGCLRGANDFPHRAYYTLNPGGPSHAYFKRLFIDRKFTPDEKPEEYSFIQALVQDNKVLMEKDPEYIHMLETLPPKTKAA